MKAKTRERRKEANEVVKSCCNQNGRKFNLSAGRTAAIATRSQNASTIYDDVIQLAFQCGETDGRIKCGRVATASAIRTFSPLTTVR